MKPYTLLTLLCCTLWISCEKQSTGERAPASKNFEPVAFTNPVTGEAIKLISETECEFVSGSDTLRSSYTKKGEIFRTVAVVLGKEVVSEFTITPDGLVDFKSQRAFLLPGRKFNFQDANEGRAECIIQIRNVQQALRAYQNINGLNPGDPLDWSKIFGAGKFIEQRPICPRQGTYTFVNEFPKIGTLGMTCSHAGEPHLHVPKNHSDW